MLATSGTPISLNYIKSNFIYPVVSIFLTHRSQYFLYISYYLGDRKSQC